MEAYKWGRLYALLDYYIFLKRLKTMNNIASLIILPALSRFVMTNQVHCLEVYKNWDIYSNKPTWGYIPFTLLFSPIFLCLDEHLRVSRYMWSSWGAWYYFIQLH